MSEVADLRPVFDALVTGRSLPALLAALDLAEVGLRVAVAGGPLDLPLGPERDVEGTLAEFLERIAAPIDPQADAEHRGESSAAHAAAAPRGVAPIAPWLLDRAGRWAPQSSPAMLGIPAVPLAQENLRLLGGGGATRAYVDRIKPLLTIGKTRMLGELVRRRLGRAALERLVDPLVRERYGVGPADVEAAVATPGLNEALSRAGSLTAAVLACSERHESRETEVEPEGGWAACFEIIATRLVHYGVEMLNEPVTGIRRDEPSGLWRAESAGHAAALSARALVLDAGVASAPAHLAAAGHPELVPSECRVYAEIDIRADGAHAERGLADDAAGVRTIDGWTLRLSPSAGGVRVARLMSPVELAAGELAEAEAGASIDDAGWNARLAAAGCAAVSAATWRWGRSAAPFALLDQRHRAEERVAAVSAAAGGTLLPVGRTLTGDDLSVALAAAHRGGIELRRRLLGLAE